MRRIVAGVDRDGRSCVVEDLPLDDSPRQGLFSLAPAELPPRPAGHGTFRDLHLAPGHVQWEVHEWPANSAFPRVHHTDTIDLHTVLRGSLTLLLGDGEHLLQEGDCAVVAGVGHAWEAGADGCTDSVVMIGFKRAAGE